MILKDPVDHVHVIEDAQHDRGVRVAQLIDIAVDQIVEAAIGPPLDVNELGVRRARHEGILRCFSIRWRDNTSDSSYSSTRIRSAEKWRASRSQIPASTPRSTDHALRSMP